MRPEITLTEEEREKPSGITPLTEEEIGRLKQLTREGWMMQALAESLGLNSVEAIVTVLAGVLDAVPRLALASPMVGELVALCREAIAKRDSSAVSSAELLRRLAAITGEG